MPPRKSDGGGNQVIRFGRVLTDGTNGLAIIVASECSLPGFRFGLAEDPVQKRDNELHWGHEVVDHKNFQHGGISGEMRWFFYAGRSRLASPS